MDNISNTIVLNSWMQHLDDITPLNKIVLPGSHDAGISELHHCDINAQMNEAMVQTQNRNIQEQLELGSRYFDIRIDYDHHKLVTYHRTGDIGCNGQSLEDVMNQSVEFINCHPSETFILKFSHIRSNRGKKQEIIDRVDELLQANIYRQHFLKLSDSTINLAKIFLGQCRGKIIMVFDYDSHINNARDGHFFYRDAFNENSTKTLVAAYHGPNLNVADKYSDTSHLEIMKKDQIKKLIDFGGLGNDYLFLLSWTLTANAETFFGGGIKELATKANQALPGTIEQIKKQNLPLPNIIYIDFIHESVSLPIVQLNFLTKKT